MTSAAIQGARGAFSHEAAAVALGADVEVLECRRFEELFDRVDAGDAAYGVVPVENTLAGAVQRSMDLLAERELHAVAEVRVRVRLCLVAPPGRAHSALRRAASHPVALQQCHRFFERHPDIEPVSAFDTAGAVRELMSGGAAYDAAISSPLAASLYGADVLEADLEDDGQNFTRFLVVSRAPAAPPARGAKTSVVFTLPHRPGALHRALGTLAERGTDLTRIESRPIPGRPWEYRFYADLAGTDTAVQLEAVAALRRLTNGLRVLGSYAVADDGRGSAGSPGHDTREGRR